MTLSNLIWRPLLASPGLRRRLAWQLKHYHPEDFDARVPIGEGLSIPLFDAELSASFSEIFLLGEYQPLLDSMPLPDRWLDLGCYAGYFSLWMEWQRRRAGRTSASNALLVDANATLAPQVERLIQVNELTSAWTFLYNAIAPGRGVCEYIQRSYMGSSLSSVDDAPGEKVSVPILANSDLAELLQVPYDLLKVDIEGAEFELLRHYPCLASRVRWMCLEWHSWAGTEAEIRSLAENLGFTFIREMQPARTVPNGAQTSVLLFRNRNLHDDA